MDKIRNEYIRGTPTDGDSADEMVWIENTRGKIEVVWTCKY